ncbi:unnamed protein product [Rotaria sp. Silwood2]|nr:unnamed protein product [Rotaria sp. Silwood2]CAF3281870.1 unnamed protein product [Rotaria sp. Silwood2]CAF3425048.1 unnamed protein product [Rotaria sp. Silwood2]CAF3994193.1 unnamed protein product [Rotaria sp. Silwood2]CAF4037979.1 unnamed protein product [Rotaria sp. Silwood2]
MSPYSFAVLLFLVIVSIVNAGEKVCPGYGFIRPPDKCESTCSREKDECPQGKKCCFRIEQPCGFQCIVPKDNEKKPGNCPTSATEQQNPYWNLCDGHFCDVDNDCKGDKKCCPNMCGSTICIAPK